MFTLGGGHKAQKAGTSSCLVIPLCRDPAGLVNLHPDTDH